LETDFGRFKNIESFQDSGVFIAHQPVSSHNLPIRAQAKKYRSMRSKYRIESILKHHDKRFRLMKITIIVRQRQSGNAASKSHL